jgi:hypothetical protein
MRRKKGKFHLLDFDSFCSFSTPLPSFHSIPFSYSILLLDFDLFGPISFFIHLGFVKRGALRTVGFGITKPCHVTSPYITLTPFKPAQNSAPLLTSQHLKST